MKPLPFTLKPILSRVLLIGAWGMLAFPLCGQISTTIGSVVKGFSIPQHNESGELVSKIGGSEANTVSPNRAVIKELTMEFYNKGAVTMKITSPKSDYWFLQNRLNTREGVIIERENMTISAQVFQWDEKEKKGVLQKNVSVVLKNFDLASPVTPPSSTPPLSPQPSSTPIRLDLTNPTPPPQP